MPQFIQYMGMIPTNLNQTCVLLSPIILGFINQAWIRTKYPSFFKNYSYLITGAWDGGALMTAFILSFAVFGAGGVSFPFPQWWGNNVSGTYDHCPAAAE